MGVHTIRLDQYTHVQVSKGGGTLSSTRFGSRMDGFDYKQESEADKIAQHVLYLRRRVTCDKVSSFSRHSINQTPPPHQMPVQWQFEKWWEEEEEERNGLK